MAKQPTILNIDGILAIIDKDNSQNSIASNEDRKRKTKCPSFELPDFTDSRENVKMIKQVSAEPISINNQGNNFYSTNLIVYDGLNYRSQAEVAIAKAFDKYNRENTYSGVTYLPNNIAVTPQLGKHGYVDKAEADFMCFTEYGMGILEVDGSQHQNDDQVEKDIKKEELWKKMGFKVIERFTASDCMSFPDQVVEAFILRLYLVAQTYERDNRHGLNNIKYVYLQTFFNIIDHFKLDFRKYQLESEAIPLSFDGYKFILGITPNLERRLCFKHKELIAELTRAAGLAFGLPFNFELVPISGGVYQALSFVVDAALKDWIAKEKVVKNKGY